MVTAIAFFFIGESKFGRFSRQEPLNAYVKYVDISNKACYRQSDADIYEKTFLVSQFLHEPASK